MNNRKGTTVRLTEEAHQLLAEKAKDLGDSMKRLASEAVILLFSRELKYNAYNERINELQTEVYHAKRFAGIMFVLGAVVSACGAYLVVMV